MYLTRLRHWLELKLIDQFQRIFLLFFNSEVCLKSVKLSQVSSKGLNCCRKLMSVSGPLSNLHKIRAVLWIRVIFSDWCRCTGSVLPGWRADTLYNTILYIAMHKWCVWMTLFPIRALMWIRFTHNHTSSAAKEKQLEKSLSSPAALMRVQRDRFCNRFLSV